MKRNVLIKVTIMLAMLLTYALTAYATKSGIVA